MQTISNVNKCSIGIGNDLVNILLERCKNKHLDRKFINKILHPHEQQHLELCRHKDLHLWMMWAGKEAAFKAYQRLHLDLIFSPKKFATYFDVKQLDLAIQDHMNHLDLIIYGTIKYQEQVFQAMWQLNNDLIHCVSIILIGSDYSNDYVKKVNYKIFSIDSSNYHNESYDTKFKAQQYLIACGFPKGIKIHKDSIILHGQQRYTPPSLLIENNPCNYMQISLSHDHGWGAIAHLDLRFI